MSGGVIAIFVKTPGLSPVKTRLADEIGADKAVAFYRLAVGATAETVRRFLAAHPHWQARFVVAERAGCKDPMWRAFPARYSGGGGLAQRLHRVLQALVAVHGRALLVGADSPQITTADLEAAAAALQRRDWVIGPAVDGGFWCLGSRIALPRAVWEEAPFDRHDNGASARVRESLVAAATRSGIPAPALLRTLHDVDHAADLEAVEAEWPETARQTAAQRTLRLWMKAVLHGDHPARRPSPVD